MYVPFKSFVERRILYADRSSVIDPTRFVLEVQKTEQ